MTWDLFRIIKFAGKSLLHKCLKKYLLPLLLFISYVTTVSAQTDWKLKANSDGIKVYSSDRSRFKV
jgi:hypothetical protein